MLLLAFFSTMQQARTLMEAPKKNSATQKPRRGGKEDTANGEKKKKKKTDQLHALDDHKAQTMPLTQKHLKTQFADKTTFQNMCTPPPQGKDMNVKMPGDHEHGMDLLDCEDFPDALHDVAAEAVDSLKSKFEFMWSIVNSDQETEWKLRFLEAENDAATVHKVSKELDEMFPLVFQSCLRAASFHKQKPEQVSATVCPWHVDTIKSIAMFFTVCHESFNLIAVPVDPDEEQPARAIFEESCECSACKKHKDFLLALSGVHAAG